MPRAGSEPRLFEVHPEVSFGQMAGAPLAASKRSWNGVAARRRLLHYHGIALPDDLGDAGDAHADDVLDAAAAAGTAARTVAGTARPIPPDPEPDERGRLVAIWC